MNYKLKFNWYNIIVHTLWKVTEENLPEYLSEKKKQGYALLGVEQTNDSVNLNKFHFPEKSVLLLGKVKNMFI